jgi:predicted DNA-binding antitoxin AbrB/MazE fold protein
VTTIRATYENGVLRPAEPLPLADGEAVELTVTPVPTHPPPASLEEALRRMAEAKTWEELDAATEAAAPFDTPLPPGYDLLEALNRTRIEEGREQLFPVGDPRRRPT